MECHRVLADDEPVYRLPGLDGRFRNWCAACGVLRVSRLDLTEPVPCEVCGRPVVSPESRRLHLHVTCGEASCYRAMRSSRARDRRQPPRVCPCGGEFKPKRADARYCSPACRQRAYRERQIARPSGHVLRRRLIGSPPECDQ